MRKQEHMFTLWQPFQRTRATQAASKWQSLPQRDQRHCISHPPSTWFITYTIHSGSENDHYNNWDISTKRSTKVAILKFIKFCAFILHFGLASAGTCIGEEISCLQADVCCSRASDKENYFRKEPGWWGVGEMIQISVSRVTDNFVVNWSFGYTKILSVIKGWVIYTYI